MAFIDFAILIGIVAAMMVLYKYADRWVKRLDARTVKAVNWAGFITGAVGGVLWYALGLTVFMYITFAGVVIYFLFYGYDGEKEEHKQDNP